MSLTLQRETNLAHASRGITHSPGYYALLILPLGNPARRPGGAGGFHLFLKRLQIDFDQLPQLRQHTFEVLSRRVVLVELSLRRTRDRHALRAHDVADAIVDRWWRVDVALSRRTITTERAQDLIRSPIQCCCVIL